MDDEGARLAHFRHGLGDFIRIVEEKMGMNDTDKRMEKWAMVAVVGLIVVVITALMVFFLMSA